MKSTVLRPCKKCKEPYPLDEMRGNCYTGYLCHECIWLELQVLRQTVSHLQTMGILNHDGQIIPRKRSRRETAAAH